MTRNRSEHHQPIDNDARFITPTRCTQIFLLSELMTGCTCSVVLSHKSSGVYFSNSALILLVFGLLFQMNEWFWVVKFTSQSEPAQYCFWENLLILVFIFGFLFVCLLLLAFFVLDFRATLRNVHLEYKYHWRSNNMSFATNLPLTE